MKKTILSGFFVILSCLSFIQEATAQEQIQGATVWQISEDSFAVQDAAGNVIELVREGRFPRIPGFPGRPGRGGGRDGRDYPPHRPAPRCESCNAFGCYYEGGGCNAFGCYYDGGGCNAFGCWYPGGSCNAFGCANGASKSAGKCN